MSEHKPRRCRECGEGTVRPLAKRGRRMAFRNLTGLPVPASLQIPTCDNCGTEYVVDLGLEKRVQAIDVALCETWW